MKRAYLILLMFLVSTMLSAQYKPLTLISKGKSGYQIVVRQNADTLTRFAAAELQKYLSLISNCKPGLGTRPDKMSKSIFIGKEWLKGNKALDSLNRMHPDAFLTLTENQNLYLAGKNPVGDIYSVYTLLEEQLGLMRFNAEEEFVPRKDEVVIPAIRQFSQPDFSYRHPHFPDKTSESYRLFNKNHTQDDWGMFVHTFQKLCPPDKYYDLHPEYFSLVNGRRIRDGQLCLSNPAVIQLLTDNLREQIKQKPHCTYWSVSQNDCYNYCECDKCKLLYEKYGSVSGAYIDMANQIARKFPDKQISTLAYQFTRSAPRFIKPDKNVNVMFCSIECNRSQPLESDHRSKDFVKDMQDWAALTRNIFMWDYVVQFKTYICPFPNFDVLQKNIQFFHKNGVPMMFQQGSGDSWSDFMEYKQSLISHLLWNANLDEKAYRKKFFEVYFGKAAQQMLVYFERVHSEMNMQSDDRSLDIYGYPKLYSDWYLRPDLLKEYKMMMDEAERLVADDPEILKRVLRQCCAVDFAYLDVALNLNHPELTFYQQKNGRREARPEMIILLNRFVDNCKQTGIKTIDENLYTPEQYQAQVLNILSMATQVNKIQDKVITSLTPYSTTYNVGGEKALTDGLFGGQHYRLNWLGYQGNDMQLLIDFGKKDTIESLETNFFLDYVSWIFLPRGVQIEASDDGKTFRTIYQQNIPEPKMNHGQKSVHFTFNFSKTALRYLRFTASSLKICPEWHRGAGQPCWIFTDEMVVK